MPVVWTKSMIMNALPADHWVALRGDDRGEPWPGSTLATTIQAVSSALGFADPNACGCLTLLDRLRA